MNKSEFHSLILEKVQFEENIWDLANFLKENETKIQKLSLISCDVGDSSISALIADCKTLKTLEELRLIDMHIGHSSHTKEIIQSLHDHKKLKIIDLSHNNIKSFKDIGEFLGKNQVLKALILKGNEITSQKEFRHILSGMEKNISVTKLQLEL